MPMTNFEFSERKINGEWVKLPDFPEKKDRYYSDDDRVKLIRLLLKSAYNDRP